MAKKSDPKDAPQEESGLDQEEELDPIAGITPLPRVTEIGWVLKPVSKAVAGPKEKKKPRVSPVGFTLRPFTPKPKKTMVTMSDLSMGGASRTGMPARLKRRPKTEAKEEDNA